SSNPPRRPSSVSGATGVHSGPSGACAGARSDQPIPAVASSTTSRTRRAVDFACTVMADVPRSAPGHDDGLQALAADRGLQRRRRRGAPVARLVEGRQVAPVVHHEQHPVVPQALEVAAPDRARATRRVAHQHAAVAQALDHDEVPVTAVVEQDDRRQALLEQLVQRQFEAVGLEAVRFQVAAHVEQGESLLADPRLVAVGVHLLEDIGFGDRVSVLVGEQGRGRGRAAAEVVLLRHRGPEPRLLEAGQLDRVTAAVGHAHAHRAGMRRRARGQRERAANGTTGAGGGPHGTGSTNWTFTAVPFWISTLEPLFWITVVMPLALANAPPSIAFRPLSTFPAWLPLTSPSFLVLTTPSH